ncbi:MAG: FAD-dependent oxidoreductase [Candidatus Caenarcaniphilales bacterium]|nr:FAD-dependent oxidoreductase [Candidatus Caenarcaniphilales bacterium]
MIIEEYDLVIIGAGISGLALGKALSNSSINFKIFDKSRGLGGRAATRRVNAQPIDTGAQYFTVSNPLFKKEVEELIQRGTVKLWTNKLNVWDGEKLLFEGNSNPRYVCPKGFTDISKEFAKVLPVSREIKITKAARVNGLWELKTDKMVELKAKRVVSTAPLPQSLELFGSYLSVEQKASLSTISFNPCLSIVIVFNKLVSLPFKGVFWNNREVLSWVANDSSKRLNATSSVLVVQCQPKFSGRFFESSDSEILEKVFNEFKVLLPQVALSNKDLQEVQVKKWRYSQPAAIYEHQYFATEDKSLYFTGDWSLEGKIEGAYMAGLGLAKNLLKVF